MADRVRVARIGAAHGIRGEVKLWSFTEDPMTVASYGPLETKDGTRHFKIDTLRPAKNFLVARLAGVGDRNAAEALCNLDLFVPRERLPPIDDGDTFYHADLVGLGVVSEDGKTIGTLSAIHNFGAGDLLEIKPADGGETLMVPFNEATVPKIDLDGKQIVVVPPAETDAKEED